MTRPKTLYVLIDSKGRYYSSISRRFLPEYPDAQKYFTLEAARFDAGTAARQWSTPVNIILNHGLDTEEIVDTIQSWSWP